MEKIRLIKGAVGRKETDGTYFKTTKEYKCEFVRWAGRDFILTLNNTEFFVPSEYVIEVCYICSGTKIYSWGGTHNGVPVHTGPCYRCESKGYLNDADRRRNYGYDNFGRKW